MCLCAVLAKERLESDLWLCAHVLIEPPNFHAVNAMEDLVNETFLVRETGSGTRLLFDHFISTYENLPAIKTKVLSSNETIKQAVMAGLGIALISGSTTEAEIEAGRVSVIDIEGLPIMRSWHIVWNAKDTPSPAACKIQEFIANNPAHLLQTTLGEPSL